VSRIWTCHADKPTRVVGAAERSGRGDPALPRGHLRPCM